MYMSLDYIDEAIVSERNLINLKNSIKNRLDCEPGDKIVFLYETKTKEFIIRIEKKDDIRRQNQEKYK